MTEQTTNNMTPENPEENSFNLYEIIFKYLVYWPWFAVSVLVCVVLAFVYLRYQAPVYNVTASVLIKEDESRNRSMGAASGALEALQSMGGFSMSNNFDNEVEILKSRTLIKKVITNLGLYISTGEKRFFGYNTPLYKTSPLEVYMSPEEADKLESGIKLHLTYTPDNHLKAKAEYVLNEEDFEIEKSFDKLPAVFPTPVGVISVTVKDSLLTEWRKENNRNLELVAYINSPTAVAKAYGENLNVDATSKTTTIAQMVVQNTSRQRAIDFINCLVAFYNQDANDEKNEVAMKSAEFIEDRIQIINQELGTTETQLADFKQKSGLTDLTSNAKLALEENSKYEQLRIENQTQIRLVEFLRDYINNPANAHEVIPANVGLQDKDLSQLIDKYNSMLIERKRLLLTSSETNPAVVNMNTGIEATRHNVQTTVTSVLTGLQITKSDLERQARKFEGRISNAPQQEKEFLSMARQQEIKAQLYIMLLQKREENAITLAATATNGRIIEEALPDKDPVSPKKKMIALAALVVGLAIPVGFVYLRDLLKYKIENRDDVERITTVGILAELPKCEKPEKGAIVIRENKNDIMEETFRGLRTNLLFMLGKDDKVVLFSSTQPGEGKSFVAGNTAVSLAFLGKKVIVVGMDIRKPGLNKVFNLSRRAEGITNYLSDPENVNLFDMIQRSDISPNLDILPGGPVPPNSTELVARDVLDNAINQLKSRYDYVILDTAPIGMVTDTAIIGRVADMCVYVCRADVTPKAGYEYINVLKNEHKFPKLSTVINGIDMSKRKNSYGYGYGKKYGYGKGYGYGYGYGYGFESNTKKTK